MSNATVVATDATSDGYHPFDEPYEHRVALFIALCREIRSNPAYRQLKQTWRSKVHSDGTSYPSWFVLGIGMEVGEQQITYHIPLWQWGETDFVAYTLDKAPECDGHTSKDVLERLKSL